MKTSVIVGAVVVTSTVDSGSEIVEMIVTVGSVTLMVDTTVEDGGVVVIQTDVVVLIVETLKEALTYVVEVCGWTNSEHASEITSQTKVWSAAGMPRRWQLALLDDEVPVDVVVLGVDVAVVVVVEGVEVVAEVECVEEVVEVEWVGVQVL